MDEPEQSQQYLLNECKTVAENCLYNAQAHFEIAARARYLSCAFLIAPACLAALSGFLVAIGVFSSFNRVMGAATAVFASIATVASSLGVDRRVELHNQAANLLTALRHEARALHETYVHELDRPDFFSEVRRIDDRYNALIQALLPTDERAFERAREKIRLRRFTPDFQVDEPTAVERAKQHDRPA